MCGVAIWSSSFGKGSGCRSTPSAWRRAAFSGPRRRTSRATARASTPNSTWTASHTGLDEGSHAVVTDAELRRGLGQREPLATLLGGAVSPDAVDAAQRADAVCGPGLTLPCAHSHPVQRCRDVFIRPPGGHAPHDGQSVLGRTAAVFTGLRLADAQLGMLAAAPMDREDDLARVLVDVSDNIRDEGAQKLLADASSRRARSRPLRSVGQAQRSGAGRTLSARPLSRASRL